MTTRLIKMLSRRQVLDMTGLTRDELWRMVQRQYFPEPTKFCDGKSLWIGFVVEDWMKRYRSRK